MAASQHESASSRKTYSFVGAEIDCHQFCSSMRRAGLTVAGSNDQDADVWSGLWLIARGWNRRAILRNGRDGHDADAA